MLCLMLESVVSFDQSIEETGAHRDTSFTLSPGLRTGWNIGDKQAIVGFAIPTTWSDAASTGVFLYMSYELPFARQR